VELFSESAGQSGKNAYLNPWGACAALALLSIPSVLVLWGAGPSRCVGHDDFWGEARRAMYLSKVRSRIDGSRFLAVRSRKTVSSMTSLHAGRQSQRTTSTSSRIFSITAPRMPPSIAGPHATHRDWTPRFRRSKPVTQPCDAVVMSPIGRLPFQLSGNNPTALTCLKPVMLVANPSRCVKFRGNVHLPHSASPRFLAKTEAGNGFFGCDTHRQRPEDLSLPHTDFRRGRDTVLLPLQH